MPLADKLIEDAGRIRALVYGPGKMRKTWWALKAAEFGFRVLMFSGEDGHSIVRQLSPEARQRVFIFDWHDGPLDGYFATAMTVALKTGDFYVKESTRQIGNQPIGGSVRVDMRSFDRDTVVVIDTWTALTNSLNRRYAFENNIDLADAKRTEWPGYRYSAMLATWYLAQLRSALRCHYIVVGHETVYEKYGKDPSDPKKQGPLEYTRVQPLSTSNPHGKTIAKEFDHVLHFTSDNPKMVWIDTNGTEDEDAGSRCLPNDRYAWDKLTFGQLVVADGGVLPAQPAAPFDFPFVEDRLASSGLRTPQPVAAIPASFSASTITPDNTLAVTQAALAAQRPSLLFKK